MKKLMMVVCAAFLLSGCATVNPFAGIASPPQEPKKIATYAQTEKQVPLKVGVTPDGKDVIAYATERSYTAGSTETPEKLGFLQRLGRWIGGLSILAVIFIVVSLAFFAGAPIVWLAKKYFAMKSAFKNTVKAIDEIPAEDYEKIAPKLKENMDEKDRLLVKKIKTEI